MGWRNVKTRAEASKQTYGSQGVISYDSEHCVEAVYPADGGHWSAYQCARKAKQGPDNLYCKQHDPAEVAQRDKEREARWKAEQAVRDEGYARTANRNAAAKTLVDVAEWIAANKELVFHDEWLCSIAMQIAQNKWVQDELTVRLDKA